MGKALSVDPATTWPLPPRKHRHIFAKLFVSVLLIGLSFRLFFNGSLNFLTSVSESHQQQPLQNAADAVSPPVSLPPLNSPSDDSPSVNEASILQQLINDTTNDMVDQHGVTGREEGWRVQDFPDFLYQKGKCDLFTGQWIPNPLGPVYNNETCPIVESHQNCLKNGRPDTGYLYWKWKPRDCELPFFDAERFLDAMRNKSWAFIGDSISRNHVQSLVCLLSKAEAAIEIYHDEEFKSKKWRFPSYNFTLAVIWSPFLIKAEINEDMNGVSNSEIQLHLDVLDSKWTVEYLNFDYIVTSGGKWFLKTSIYWENNTIIGCHYCPGKNLTELGFEHAYRKALGLVLNFLTRSDYKGVVIFRTTTPDHFENGEWWSGGICNRTVPFREGEVDLIDLDKIFRTIELEEYKKAADGASENGVELKLLDTTHLSLLRPDGHPGPYRQFHPFVRNDTAKVQNDCLHWCLPGPLDSWNDIIMEMILNQ